MSLFSGCVVLGWISSNFCLPWFLYPDNVGVDEVMVVAYGTSRKEQFTGSASTIDGSELEKFQSESVSRVHQASGSDLINQILLERRIELWGEGFAGFDIKRLNQALDRTGSNHDPVVASVMTLPAESNRFVYQIPQQEIDANGNIGEQDQNL